MLFIYNIGIRIYSLLITLVSPFNSKAALWKNGRKDQFDKIKKQLSRLSSGDRFMIHAASFGEYEMSKPIIEALKKNVPSAQFIISFYSPSGYENTQFEDDNFIKIYLPLDTIYNQKKLIELIQPKAVIFIKYEFWYNLLRVLSKMHVPYYYTSLHLNRDSYIFWPISKTFKQLIKKAKCIYCHNLASLNILKDQGFTNLNILGDTRIDKSLENREKPFKIGNFNPCNKPTLIIGSLTSDDEEMVINYINTHDELAYIIAPHDIEMSTLNRLETSINKSTSRLSQNTSTDILLIDTMGDLKYIYAHSDYAYVGAGFLKGPHNVLEPLVFNNLTFCGPNIKKFPMAQTLKKEGLLQVIETREQFSNTIEQFEESDRKMFQEKVADFFKVNKSNLDLLINDIKETILDSNA